MKKLSALGFVVATGLLCCLSPLIGPPRTCRRYHLIPPKRALADRSRQ